MSKFSKLMYLFSGLSFISMIILRFLLGGWTPYLWIPLGLCFIFAVAPFFLDYKVFVELFSLKTTRNGLNMGTSIVLVMVLLAGINFIGVKKQKTFDLSLGKVNSLSDQTVKLLDSLTEDLTVVYFYQKDQDEAERNKRGFIELTNKYRAYSTKVKLDFVDVNEKPAMVKDYGVDKGSGVVFVTYKGKRQRIDALSEQELTGAIAKSMREKDQVVYYLTGHGEGDLNDQSLAEGMGALKQLLDGKGYPVKALSLTTDAKIPDDANMLLIMGPTQTFLDYEIKAVEEYLKKGGNVILAVTPTANHGLDQLLKNVGIAVTNNYVLKVIQTPMGKVVNPSATPITIFSEAHAITKVFKKDQSNIIMKLPTALTKLATLPTGITVDEIAKTEATDMGFANTNFKEPKGSAPYTVAMAARGKYLADTNAKEFNLVVFGDVNMFDNQFLYQRLNRDILLNSLAFMSKEEKMISITPKEVAKTELNFNQEKFYLFIFAFVIPLPFLLLITSGVLWFKRRHA